MAKPKDPNVPRHPGPPNQENPDDDGPRHDPEGRERQVHQEILERRLRGGPQPTPEEYARALEQWKNLPGSVIRPPTDVTPPHPQPPSETPGQAGSSPEQPNPDDRNDGTEQRK